jgi:1,4-alpha-glucan branching enzyme
MQIEQQLESAHCTYPFEYLGVKRHEKESRFTAWIPNAKSVSVFDLSSGKSLGKLKKSKESCLFTGVSKKHKEGEAYGFKVKNDETDYQIIDAYQFQ